MMTSLTQNSVGEVLGHGHQQKKRLLHFFFLHFFKTANLEQLCLPSFRRTWAVEHRR
jgi:hypothetical protein